MTTNHLFFWTGRGWGTLLTPNSTMGCTRATMVTKTLRENKRNLRATAEDGNLTDVVLGQVLTLLFGLLPGSNRLFIAFITPTQFPA